MTKIVKISAALMFSVVAALIFITRCSSRRSDFIWLQEVSGVRFPASARELARFDNGEWYYVCVVEISELEFEDFIAHSNFKHPDVSGDAFHTKPVFMIQSCALSLGESCGVLPDINTSYCLRGGMDKNRWEFVADEKNHKVFCLIMYPDWAGDAP